MSLIVLPSSLGTGKCRLMYDNLLEQGTVLASSENADYPVENCFDWNTADYFCPLAGGTINVDLTLSGPSPANFLAFYNQDLYKYAGAIRLQYWNGSSYVNATSDVYPADNTPRVVFFDSTISDKWRLVVTCASVFNLGVVAFGQYVSLQYGNYLGWTPPALARATKVTNNISDSGAFLGRSIDSKGVFTTLILQYAQDSWVRDYWAPFILHAEQKPFFWLPDADNYPDEAVFCWTEADIPPPTHTHYGYMGVELQIRGLRE